MADQDHGPGAGELHPVRLDAVVRALAADARTLMAATADVAKIREAYDMIGQIVEVMSTVMLVAFTLLKSKRLMPVSDPTVTLYWM